MRIRVNLNVIIFVLMATVFVVLENECDASFFPKLLNATQGNGTTITDFRFDSEEGFEMKGRIAVPSTTRPHAVVILVQSPQSSTIEDKCRLGNGKIASRTELFFREFPKLGIGFCAYEGRGVFGVDKSTNFEVFEKIDRKIFNTSSLNNKVNDALLAVQIHSPC